MISPVTLDEVQISSPSNDVPGHFAQSPAQFEP
jgi:hypothetical protein